MKVPYKLHQQKIKQCRIITRHLPSLRTPFPVPFGPHPDNFRPFADQMRNCCVHCRVVAAAVVVVVVGVAHFPFYSPPYTCRCSWVCDEDVGGCCCFFRLLLLPHYYSYSNRVALIWRLWNVYKDSRVKQVVGQDLLIFLFPYWYLQKGPSTIRNFSLFPLLLQKSWN